MSTQSTTTISSRFKCVMRLHCLVYHRIHVIFSEASKKPTARGREKGRKQIRSLHRVDLCVCATAAVCLSVCVCARPCVPTTYSMHFIGFSFPSCPSHCGWLLFSFQKARINLNAKTIPTRLGESRAPPPLTTTSEPECEVAGRIWSVDGLAALLQK